jgi:lipopolysaccharide/colanic/teichoic acid biosynthesis glycosyltransferase
MQRLPRCVNQLIQQVSRRSDLPWDEAVRLDVRYVKNWSLALDLQILWKTWAAVFTALALTRDR